MPFNWTERSEQAAAMVAADKLTDEEIASVTGITRRALAKWKNNDDFVTRVNGIVEATRNAVLTIGVADRRNRVERLNRDWERLQQVQDARAELLVNRPESGGGFTGLIVHDQKGVGAGTAAEVVDTYTLDGGLLAELRNIEKQAAQELGQWVEKQAQTTPDGTATVPFMVLGNVKMDEL